MRRKSFIAEEIDKEYRKRKEYIAKKEEERKNKTKTINPKETK